MKEDVKTIKSIRQIEKFKEDGIFYSFKYEYAEIFGDGKRYFELKSKITVLVENQEQKRLYFKFEPDVSQENTSYGKLSVVAREEAEAKIPSHLKQRTNDLVKVNFTSLTESTQFTTILNRVHSECVKIISSKFKDVVSDNDVKSFFS